MKQIAVTPSPVGVKTASRLRNGLTTQMEPTGSPVALKVDLIPRWTELMSIP